jgi:hypothetical protein
MKTLTLLFIAFALLSAHAQEVASAELPLGLVKSFKIVGHVTRLRPDGTQGSLSDGDWLREGDSVVTSKKGGVILVFQNGCSITLTANTSLKIDEFKSAPFSDDSIVDLLEEPVSRTKVTLAYGAIDAEMKQLRTGSVYLVKAPDGAVFLQYVDGNPPTLPQQIKPADGMVHLESTGFSITFRPKR